MDDARGYELELFRHEPEDQLHEPLKFFIQPLEPADHPAELVKQDEGSDEELEIKFEPLSPERYPENYIYIYILVKDVLQKPIYIYTSGHIRENEQLRLCFWGQCKR